VRSFRGTNTSFTTLDKALAQQQAKLGVVARKHLSHAGINTERWR
jgi:hypothetical protein